MSFVKTAAFSGFVGLALMMTASAAEDRKLIDKKPAGEPTTDQEFLVRAIACEVAAVKYAEKASKNASHEDVKKLAQTMLDDHKKIRDDLMEQARKMKVGVVEGLDKEHREQYDKLSKLDGADFDREYLRCLAEGHEKSIKMYKKWAKDAKEAGIREAAENAMTKAQDHMAHVKKLRKDKE